MKNFGVILSMAIAVFASAVHASAPAAIRVSGRHLVDAKGNCVRLAGVMQSIHPFFNHGYWGGGSDDAAAQRALEYYDRLCTVLTDRKQVSYCNMIRLTVGGHVDFDNVLVSFAAHSRDEFTGLAVYGGKDDYYTIGKTLDRDKRPAIQLVRIVRGQKNIVAATPLKDNAPVMLRAERKGDAIRFLFSMDGKEFTPVGGAQSASILPSKYSVGVYATSNALR